MNFEQAFASMETKHHWSLKVNNRKGKRRYECTILDGGRRVTSERATPRLAILASLDELQPTLKVVG